MNKTELKALIKEAFLAEKKNTLLNENAPGFDNRKQGEALPTLESVKAAYEAKKLEEAVEDTKEEKIKHIESKFGHLDTVRKGKFTVEEENGHFTFIPDSFEELASDNDEEADDQGGSKILKQIEAAINETLEDTKEETEATKELTAAVKDLGDAKAEAGLKEDRFVDSSLEDLRQVVRNLAHTAGMDIEAAAEMAMMHIEDMFMGGEEEEDMMQEGTPTVFDDKSMDDLLNIILKYVEDPADAEKELERFDSGGFEAMSDSVQANLDRDEEYKAWYNKLHSVEEDATPLKKDYWADHTDIGMFYVEGSEEEKSLTDNEFEELGKKIVKHLYAGDVKKAYDDIVRGKKRGSYTDINEISDYARRRAAERDYQPSKRDVPPKKYKEPKNDYSARRKKELDYKYGSAGQEMYEEETINESVIAEADMIIESFRTKK